MHLGQLKQNTPEKRRKRVGRGGKRGTYSGKGQKGQKSRSGAGMKPGFRGGDNRIWQLFPKKRGASKKLGNAKPHRKHRYFRVRYEKPIVFNLGYLNKFKDGDVISPKLLFDKGMINDSRVRIKILGNGDLKKKISLEGFEASKSARDKINKVGGTVK